MIPRATYRLQLNADFTFRDATRLIPYLARLGISHVYCSPYFRARPGSRHGYDVVDHNAFNPELGTREDFDAFVATLRAHGMGHIVDFVPNHVGIMGADNAWWMDVLENGRASRYGDHFDIDWAPPNPALANKLLVPVLGAPYGSVLEAGELRLVYEEQLGSFAVFYHQHRFPLDPCTYPSILEAALAQPCADAIPARPRLEFESLAAAFRKLPSRDSLLAEDLTERDRDKELHKQRLGRLLDDSVELREALSAALRWLGGEPPQPKSYDALHLLLEQQVYRLAYWRVAADDINYRRFFDVNDLAALRMENPRVFEATHRLLLELLHQGQVDGVRIDHPDGLYDPLGYFIRLQQAAAPGSREPGLYLLVEKILASFERLPRSWPVHGTTGYNFANVVNGLFVDARSKLRMDRIYRSFIIDYVEWAEVATESALLVLRTALAAELNVLANQLARIAQADRHTRDFTLSNLRQALMEVIARFPVYRSYVGEVSSVDDRRYIDWAIARARRYSSVNDLPLFDFINAMLLAEAPLVDPALQADVVAFARKFQQVTAPVTAKGVEDTALYRFTRLVSLNEVGAEPENFGTSVRQFHADAQHRARQWPHEMLATSTHDTKRSEDVRARISVLSELPAAWRRALSRWTRMNRSRRRIVDDLPAPGPHAEYLYYQTLLGTWPIEPLDDAQFGVYRERIEEYMIKAAREAKRRTSWANVHEDYEEALRQYVRSTLDRRDSNRFLAEVDVLARQMAPLGYVNSLAQTLCKLTAPGVPDIYQGNEVWDDSLVDPDNRRAVDYRRRESLLDEVTSWWADPAGLAGRLGEALGTLEDGRCKLHLVARVLQFRQGLPALFREGHYVPLRVRGEHAAHVLAFARVLRGDWAVTVVPRLRVRVLRGLAGGATPPDAWQDTRVLLPARLQASNCQNPLDGRSLRVTAEGGDSCLPMSDLFQVFPVAFVVPGTSGSA